MQESGEQGDEYLQPQSRRRAPPLAGTADVVAGQPLDQRLSDQSSSQLQRHSFSQISPVLERHNSRVCPLVPDEI